MCKVCGNEEPLGRRLAVDHDHVTGAIRGLVCTRCNRLIGMAEDDPALLVKAARYLHGERPGVDIEVEELSKDIEIAELWV